MCTNSSMVKKVMIGNDYKCVYILKKVVFTVTKLSRKYTYTTSHGKDVICTWHCQYILAVCATFTRIWEKRGLQGVCYWYGTFYIAISNAVAQTQTHLHLMFCMISYQNLIEGFGTWGMVLKES